MDEDGDRGGVVAAADHPVRVNARQAVLDAEETAHGHEDLDEELDVVFQVEPVPVDCDSGQSCVDRIAQLEGGNSVARGDLEGVAHNRRARPEIG